MSDIKKSYRCFDFFTLSYCRLLHRHVSQYAMSLPPMSTMFLDKPHSASGFMTHSCLKFNIYKTYIVAVL